MTRRRWIADEVSGTRAVLSGAHADHLAKVLRARTGQEFDIVAGTRVRRGTITSIGSGKIEFELGEEIPATATVDVVVLLSIFKFDRMEWAIEKCTEIGVARIIPVIARRTDAHLAAAAVKRRERWQRIARQAAEQSRRAAAPEVGAPVKLKELDDVLPAGELTRVVLAESEEETRLGEVLQFKSGEVVLAVGPEGGWASGELSWFFETGWVGASLGETILRAETAAIVATALALEQ